jgi:chitin disaccharide deacetylase
MVTAMERCLIVNADDYGLSDDVNFGILKAHRQGIVTSASLMVRWPSARDAVEQAVNLDLGLHIDLGEWAFRNGEWVSLYQRVSFDEIDALENEIRSQLELFRSLAGRNPSHLDSHQHVHLQEPVRSLVKRMADELSVPLRGMSPKIRYCGSFYGQSGKGEPCPDAISLVALIDLLRNLPPGVTELACHPGSAAKLDSTYCKERSLEAEVLCHPVVQRTILDENIRLCTFDEQAETGTLCRPIQAQTDEAR